MWIPSEHNPADVLTKEKCLDALGILMETNCINVNPDLWVEIRNVNENCK